jgi:ribonuclease BN (tRNA processing enzyme)
MRLTVLGGSAAGPNPGQGCSGYLLQSGSTRVVLDLGPGTFPELRKHVNFREIDGIIISHLHIDHWLDILAMRFALAYNPVPPPSKIPLWLPPVGRALLDRLAVAISEPSSKHDYFSVFDAEEFDPAGELTIGEMSFRFHPTVHYVPCWAIRASNSRAGDLLYTADTGPAASFGSFATGSFVVVAEGTAQAGTAEPIETRGHLTPAEAGALASQANAWILVLSHLWAENDPFNALEEARLVFGGKVELATPGLAIQWNEPRL